jgi:hypothetical protein
MYIILLYIHVYKNILYTLKGERDKERQRQRQMKIKNRLRRIHKHWHTLVENWTETEVEKEIIKEIV